MSIGRDARPAAFAAAGRRRGPSIAKWMEWVAFSTVSAAVVLLAGLLVLPAFGQVPDLATGRVPNTEKLGLDKAVLVAGLTPLVVLAVWWGMRRVRARLHDAAGDHAGHGDL